jgi:site-specific DNA-methyltransferase (adenine-specific)
MRKAKLIEPINASFEEVMLTILGVPQELPEMGKVADTALTKWLNKVHCGDCIELMNQMPEKSVSCIVTSPPYNLKNSTGNGMKNGNGGKWANAELINGYSDHTDDMPHEDYVKWQRNCLTAMMRVLKDDGVIFYNHKRRVQNGLLQDRQDIVDGFPVRQIIIWKRQGGINFNTGYFLPTYEVIYMICKPNFKLTPGFNRWGDVWEIGQAKGIKHPAPFPIELAQRCVEASPGGVVLDPFFGSGQTGIAAISKGREWIGMDISAEYCSLAESRIRDLQTKYSRKL